MFGIFYGQVSRFDLPQFQVGFFFRAVSCMPYAIGVIPHHTQVPWNARRMSEPAKEKALRIGWVALKEAGRAEKIFGEQPCRATSASLSQGNPTKA
ncbi:MAG: hypothetical protein JO232_14505 [Verrucomicrobia bacterium]|nr:hypothetical protein [Verrucomicrobiota bacterium]